MKYDSNMAIKTEGAIADDAEGLLAAQENVNLLKHLISENEKLKAEILEKDANLEQLRSELEKRKNAMDYSERSDTSSQEVIVQDVSNIVSSPNQVT